MPRCTVLVEPLSPTRATSRAYPVLNVHLSRPNATNSARSPSRVPSSHCHTNCTAVPPMLASRYNPTALDPSTLSARVPTMPRHGRHHHVPPPVNARPMCGTNDSEGSGNEDDGGSGGFL